MNPKGKSGCDQGAVMFTAMVFILIMSILGVVAYVITAIDSTIAVNLEVSRKAFYSAEAGVHFALASIQKSLKANTMRLPETDGASVSLSSCILPPDPDITDIRFAYLPTDAPVVTRIAENAYQFTVRGYSSKNADADIRVTFKNRSAFKFGAFGDKKFTAPVSSHFYGYDSRVTLTPVGDNGANACDIGSNRIVSLSGGTEIHGHIGLGSHDSTTAVYMPSGSPLPHIYGPGEAVRQVGQVDPDPLGVLAGAYAKHFRDCSNSNDNDHDTMPSALTVEAGKVITLSGKSGGANYYFTKIELETGATMNMDTSAGPIHIYLSGEFNGKSGTIDHVGGDPRKLAIFSNTADPVSLSNASAFYGVIYAPYADLEIDNHAPLYGAILAGTVDMKNPGDFYFDQALKDKYLTRDVVMTSWYDVRR